MFFLQEEPRVFPNEHLLPSEALFISFFIKQANSQLAPLKGRALYKLNHLVCVVFMERGSYPITKMSNHELILVTREK
jgi:hypothetical protein